MFRVSSAPLNSSVIIAQRVGFGLPRYNKTIAIHHPNISNVPDDDDD
jgi:hypothetical protein